MRRPTPGRRPASIAVIVAWSGLGCVASSVAGFAAAASAQPAAVEDPPVAAAPAPAAPEPAQPLLRREGDFVVERPARLVELADGALAARFDPPGPTAAAAATGASGVDDEGFLAAPPEAPPAATLPPMVLQPSRQLDALREVHASSDPDAGFALSGRVQRYRGRNHLLLSGFAGLRPVAERAEPTAAAAAVAPGPGTPAAGAAAGDAATAGVESLMDDLDADARQPSGAATPPRAAGTDPAPAQGIEGPGWRDGELIARRLGRVVPGDAGSSHPGSVFVFESGDPPLRLLASAAAERAEDLVDGGRSDPLFELTGQVSVSGREAWVLPASLRWRPAAGRVDDAADR